MGRVHLRRYSTPDARTVASHTFGDSELSFGETHGELDGETGRPSVQPVPSGLGSLFSFPRSISSHEGSVRVCGPRVHVQPPRFRRTWCSRKSTFRRDSGPRLGHQGQQPLLVMLSDKTWLSWVTCWKLPRQPASGGPPPLSFTGYLQDTVLGHRLTLCSFPSPQAPGQV